MDYLEEFRSPEGIEPVDDWGVYKTLLESTLAIPWKINWKTKQFDYIGPQIETLLGWPQQSWLGAMDWIERIHPEDREAAANFCIRQSEAGVDHETDYRALKADGGHVWIRDVIHVIRNEAGETTDLVGFMFDISRRKQLEEDLLAANRKLEELSSKDGLTGIGNRHLFDRSLEAEWARAQRSGTPFSLILFDIDHFKQYNDTYGHVMGDECLRKVAEAVGRIPLRSTDLFARYGGEEFVLLLPETPRDAAVRIAEMCRVAIQGAQIEHRASSCGPHLSISVGVATLCPAPDLSADRLIRQADEVLYVAKGQGRNRVCATPQAA